MYSIIITTYGTKGVPMVDNLLDSISKFNNINLDEIIISNDGDDNSIMSELNLLKDKYENRLEKIKLTFSKFNHSYSKTVNNGMRMTNTDNDVLLLNNDMVALTSFEPFTEFTKNNKDDPLDIGIIGAKLLYPNLYIQHAGINRIKFTHYFRHAHKHRIFDHAPSNFPRKYIAVTGACQYINRKLIDKIGYLDETYVLSYEDVDYCINSQLNGYSVWYIPDVMLIHYESVTRGRSKYDAYNLQRFWTKWNGLYHTIDPEIKNETKIASGVLGIGALRLLYLMAK